MLLTVVLCLFLASSVTCQTVLATSSLATCVNDGTTSTTELTCSEKLIVNLVIAAGSNLVTESLDFTIPCIDSSDGICPCSCDYTTDSSCTCRDLTQSINVTLTKSAVMATYPLTYVQSFNSKPYEEVIMVGGDYTISECDAGGNSASPTCGWATDASGDDIVNSQGFCCECTLSAVYDSSIGGDDDETTRGNLNCDLFSSGLFLDGVPGSAHCMRYADLYYAGYQLGASELDFAITISITSTTNATNASVITESLQLDPSDPYVLDDANLVSAELLGDLLTYDALEVFTSYYLMIPSPTGEGAQLALTTNLSRWMLVPYSMVNLDGTECNMVGTGYTAFLDQSNACYQLEGTCLANQLDDLTVADLALEAAGTTPLYLVGRYGGGISGSTQAFRKVANGPLWFGLPITSISNSEVVLNVNAASLELVVNASPGKIMFGQVCQYGNSTCGSFEALTQRGYLITDIANTGYVNASYTITVSNCSAGITNPVAQESDIATMSVLRFTFDIYTTTNLATDASCTVGLINSLGKKIDTLDVGFTTNATVYDTAPTQSDISSEVTGTGNSTNATSTSCSSECALYNLTCAIKDKCYSRIGLFFGYIGIAMVVAAVLWVGFRRGWWLDLISFALKHINKGKSKTSASKSKHKKKKKKSKAASAPEEGPAEDDTWVGSTAADAEAAGEGGGNGAAAAAAKAFFSSMKAKMQSGQAGSTGNSAARESVFMKLYAQMMQHAPGMASRTSTSSEDPLVASSPSGTGAQTSAGIKSSPRVGPDSSPGGKRKSPQRMSQMLMNKLMMTNPLAFNMLNRGAVSEETEEDEQAGPLQSGSLQMTPYKANAYDQPDAQQQIMAESLRAKYGTEADPSWQGQGQQSSWNPTHLLPAPDRSLATQESDISLQFDQPSRAGIGQFGAVGFAQSQNAAYQQKLLQQKQQQQQQRQQQQQEQQQRQQSGSDEGRQGRREQGGQAQYGAPAAAQAQSALYQQRLQQHRLLQQQPRQQLLQLQSSSPAAEGQSDLSDAASYDHALSTSSSGQPLQQMVQSQQQSVQQSQFGSAGYAQGQSAIYQQKLLQQRQKQLQQQQVQQQQLLQGAESKGGMQVAQPDSAGSPLYGQLQLQQQQQLPGLSGQLGSAQHAQGQAAMYQQKLQQLKQRQQQQQQQSAMQALGMDQVAQGQQQAQQEQQMQQAGMQQAAASGSRQLLPTTAMQAVAAGPATADQMGSVGFALAQNAKYQQQLQQQQLRRQQRQQLEQQLEQQQQQPSRQLPQQQQGSTGSLPPRGQSSEAVVQQLMQQYAATGCAYLNLAKLKQPPSSLRSPGPNPSLVGDLQIVEDISAQGQAQIYFTLKPGHTQQLVQYNAAMGQYEMLQQPWLLDDAQFALLLTSKNAQKLLAIQDPGQCLN